MRLWAGLVGVVLALSAAPAIAQTRLFTDDSDVPLILEAPLNSVISQAARNTDPRPGFVTLTGGASPQRFDIQLSARGVSRRTRGACAIPPLRLDFDQAQVRNTLLAGQNKLKLVVRCRPGYENYVLLEYLSYRMYNELTPLSYRVRPVVVTYRDTEGRRREETTWNFVIEDVDDVAHRNHQVALDLQTAEVNSSALNPQAAARYALFQYMLSNVDWDMTQGHAGEVCCHNSKLLAASATQRTNLIPIPYDFDSTGFVNPPYAGVPEGLGPTSVLVRIYRGYCRHNAEIPAAIAEFQAHRAAITALVTGETRLAEGRRRTALNYINSFYDIISDPQRVDRQIIQRCR